MALWKTYIPAKPVELTYSKIILAIIEAREKIHQHFHYYIRKFFIRSINK